MASDEDLKSQSQFDPLTGLAGGDPQASQVSLGDVHKISRQLRETIHDMNNALFVMKGFMDELSTDVRQELFRKPDYDCQTFKDMFEAVHRNMQKLDASVQSLRHFARKEIYSEAFAQSRPVEDK